VANKQATSFEGLYDAHHPKVRRLCRMLLKDSAEAEETGQEVFLKLFKQYQSDNWPDDWNAWLTRVTVNACHDRRKSAWWKWWRSSNGEVQLAESESALAEVAENLSRVRASRSWRWGRRFARALRAFTFRRHSGPSALDTALARLGAGDDRGPETDGHQSA